jgi:exodeoxyribonuclease V gamma subunit
LLVGKNGQVCLPPLEPSVARQYFERLVAAYAEGLCAPLPLTPKTGFAWLEKGSDVARKVYEGDDYLPGEVQRNEYLARAWPDYAHLVADGRFERACRDLLEPLAQVLVSRAKGLLPEESVAP